MGLLISPPLARRLGIEALKQPRLSSLLFSVHHHLTLSHNLFQRKHSTTCIAECDFNDFDDNADAKARDKDAALRSALSRISSDFGRESMLSLQRFFRSRRAPVISTGSLNLDIALGTGGLPKGRIVEIYGQEASGKTTLALHIVKEAQKLGGYCAYLDVENAMDPSLAESIGVNTENLLISYPNSAENVLNVVDTLTKSGSLDVIVVDSVAALVPQCELDGVIGDEYPYPNAQSRIMTQALRKIQSSLFNSRTLLVFLNQVRWNPNSRQGGPLGDVTAGGNALRFYAAVRLRIKRTQLIKTEDEITGLGISVQVMKNKLAPAMKKADLEIQFGRGLRCESEVLQLACEHGIIATQGGNYLIGRKVFSSQQAVERCLAENDKLLDKIVEILRNRLFERESLVK